MRVFERLKRYGSASLAQQFLLAGGAVSLVAAIIVGAFVTHLIEVAVTRNSAAATALYVDSVIAPLLPDMQTSEVLGDTISRALDETLGQGALGRRLMSFRLWRADGTILYSNHKELVGKRFEPSEDLKTAFSGKMVAEFNRADDTGSEMEKASGQPLLEIYNPILQPWSGEVVAVSEFYEIADDFQHSLNQARLRSWLAVSFFTLSFFLILSALVFRGSRTIDRQRQTLKRRVDELSDLVTQNNLLHLRVQRASQRTAALNERYLRRIGADLHDGPAQLVALAALRIDGEILSNPSSLGPARDREIASIKACLDDALREIRDICGGLVLPQIEEADLGEILDRAVQAHRRRTDVKVEASFSDTPPKVPLAAKICIYRFVQEALYNGFRHGGGIGQRVTQAFENGRITIVVADSGPGFDPAQVKPTSLGLAGMRERIESLGGHFDLESSAGGTVIRMSLNMDELEPA